ncbi:hypothetical protein, partial [Thiolapillus sp.]|uniref:hypothetical protein n=1 Tax=Thiolapillus sp. TaxID=2017437 RepID=UPI003AF88584
PSQNLHPNNSPDLFKSDTGDDRLPQNPVGGGVGKYDKVELPKILPRAEISTASFFRKVPYCSPNPHPPPDLAGNSLAPKETRR